MFSAPLQAVLLCYDITNYDSFVNLEDWMRLVVKSSAQQQTELEQQLATASSTSMHSGDAKALGDMKPTVKMPYLGLIGNKSALRLHTVLWPALYFCIKCTEYITVTT
jgi:hypothetical protein